MDLTKQNEFFDPHDLPAIHIIGCGAIGSTLAELLTRCGVEALHLYDFDVVTPHNITNQMYRHDDIGKEKVIVLSKILKEINPEISLTLHSKGYNPEDPSRLSGYIFLAVDNIEIRQAVVKQAKPNKAIKAIFDFRMRLTDAQHYAADWSDEKQQDNLLNSMNFTNEEAAKATPVNACGSTLSIAPTVRTIVSLGVSNFINFTKGNPIKKLILVDAFNYTLDAF